MENRRSGRPVSGEAQETAAVQDALAVEAASGAEHDATREGDVIQGLRSGLLFSLAIWVVLLTVGTLVFA